MIDLQSHPYQFILNLSSNPGSISFSHDGDLIQYISPLTIRIQSIFDISRPSFPPDVSLHSSNIIVPLAPQLMPLNNAKGIMSSFFGGEKVYGAWEIENICELNFPSYYVLCPPTD